MPVLRTLAVVVLATAAAGRAQAPNTLSAEELAQGFELLYDGTREGFNRHWVDYVKNRTDYGNLGSEWQVDSSTGAIGIKNATEDVRSRRIFRDFDLRLDYRCDGNQGVFYRTLVTTDRAWQTGIEYAIDDRTLEDRISPGAAFDLFPPRPNTYHLFKTGAWNAVRILAQGDSIEHWMNGTKVVAFRLHTPRFWDTYARSKWSADSNLTFSIRGRRDAGPILEGYLGFQGDHGGRWEIRNLRIREFPPSSAAGPPLSTPQRPARGTAFAGLVLFSDGADRWADLAGRIRLPKATGIAP